MTKDSKAIDVGAVVQFVGVGASVGKTQESLYLVKDTDTVALERNAPRGATKFAWQFRPVLGRRTVEPGMRQVYALISVPRGSSTWQGTVTATTRWRRYDRKTKSVGRLVDGTEDNPQYKITLPVGSVGTTDYALKPYISKLTPQDLGNGQILVFAEGEGFTPDTTIVLGNTVLNRPENGLTVANERRLIVLAPAQLLAQSPMVIGRYGTTPFTRSSLKCYPDTPKCVEMVNAYSDLTLKEPVVKARDPQNSEVTIRLVATNKDVNIPYRLEHHRPIIDIGGRVFGLSDAPFISENFTDAKTCLSDNNLPPGQAELPCAELTFAAPTQLLANARLLTFKEFLWTGGAPLTTKFALQNKFTVTGLTALGSNGDRVQLAITGGGFTEDVRVLIGDLSFAFKCDADEDGCTPGLKLRGEKGAATLITLSPTKGQIKDVKQVVVMQGMAQPQPLSLTPPSPPVPTAKIIMPSEPFSVGKGDSVRIKFLGANFESIKKVLFEGKEVASKPDDDDKTILWVDLQTFLTGEVGKKRIIFVMKDDKEVPFTVIVQPQ